MIWLFVRLFYAGEYGVRVNSVLTAILDPVQLREINE